MIQAMTPPTLAIMGVSKGRLKAREERMDSKMVTAKPMVMAESRKKRGRRPVCQRGESLWPAMIIRVPREDWCMVGSRMPRATMTGSHLSRLSRASRALGFWGWPARGVTEPAVQDRGAPQGMVPPALEDID